MAIYRKKDNPKEKLIKVNFDGDFVEIKYEDGRENTISKEKFEEQFEPYLDSNEEPKETKTNTNTENRQTKSENNPKDDDITFFYDKESSKLFIKRGDKIATEVSIATLKGEDGEDAYQLWKQRQKDGVDSSFPAFLETFRGKEGKEGVEGPKGEPGKTGDVGPQGKEGKSAFDVWKEQNDPNSNKALTLQDFLNDIASRVQTQEGATYTPEIQNGQLVFTNSKTGQKTEAKDVRGKDGATFYPRIDTTTNELYFVDDKEIPQTPRYKIKGEDGKEGKTFIPKWEGTSLYFETKDGEKIDARDLRGKDAFEVWKERHHITEEDDKKAWKKYEAYYNPGYAKNKEEKNENKKNYNYEDIINNTNSTLKVNRHIITDSELDDDENRGIVEYYNYRKKRIENIREKGRNKRGNCFQEFFWWCAGVDKSLIRECPADFSKYVGIGTVIFFTALMAFFSCFYAIDSLVFKGNTAISLVVALFWGSMIFFLDRFITNTMYSDGKTTISWLEFRSGLPRIIISIILGIVISAPLELKIFEQEVKEEVNLVQERKIEDKINEDRVYLSIINSKQNLEKEKNDAYDAIREIDSLYNNKHQRYYSTERHKNYTPTSYVGTDSKGKQLDKPTSAFTGYTYDTVPDKELYNSDKNTAVAKYDSLKEKYDNYEDYVIKPKVDSLKKYYKDKFLAENEVGLLAHLNALHNVALKKSGLKEKDNTSELNPISIETKVIFGGIIFILSLLIALKSIITNYKEEKHWSKFVIPIVGCLIAGLICGIFTNTLYSLVNYLCTSVGLIMLLFIIIDVSPVFYKMMLADGKYDKILAQDKKIEEDLIRLQVAIAMKKVNDGELNSLAPYIFGKTFDKVSNKLKKLPRKDQKLETALDLYEDTDGLHKKVKDANEKIFKDVLDMKYRIAWAAYTEWYRDMYDNVIGKNDDEEGKKYNPKNAKKKSSSDSDNIEKESKDEHNENSEENNTSEQNNATV